MCKFDAEIKSYKDRKTILIYHNYYLPCTYNSKRCRYVCNCYYYDRAVHISVAVDMRTLLDRTFFSSRINGQVAARRVTGLIIKRLCLHYGGVLSPWRQLGSHCRMRLQDLAETLQQMQGVSATEENSRVSPVKQASPLPPPPPPTPRAANKSLPPEKPAKWGP